MMGNPAGVDVRFIGGGSGGGVPGQAQLGELTGGHLALVDASGETRASGGLVPRLSEAIPSVENGLWKIFPDGRMETTWKVRPGAVWHDGTLVTSADVLFTATLDQDRDLPIARRPEFGYVERIEAPDPATVVVTWKQAYIQADTLFDAPLVPKHVLEPVYLESKEAFVNNHAAWSEGYIGAGPYRVKNWVRDSHVDLEAFDGYVLGRPKVDEITVKFLADERAFMANILANAIDVTVGKSVTHEQTVEINQQWSDGRSHSRPSNTIKLWPQFMDPGHPLILNVQFRKALMHAINRHEMVETIMSGQSQVAHSELMAGEEYYPEGEAQIVRYDYDPRRAERMIEALGYAKDTEGMFVNAQGDRIAVQVQATDEDQNTKPMFAVVDYWKRVGVAGESYVIPVQQASDREFRATFPGFNLQGSTSGWARVILTTSEQARLPSNNYTGRNYARYQNPEFDALIARFTSTIPHQERTGILQQIMRHWTDQLIGMSLYYAMTSSFVSNRMMNAGFNPTWNAHEWDVRS
jgi:peptide/nickel transport system substrate-binding protein